MTNDQKGEGTGIMTKHQSPMTNEIWGKDKEFREATLSLVIEHW